MYERIVFLLPNPDLRRMDSCPCIDPEYDLALIVLQFNFVGPVHFLETAPVLASDAQNGTHKQHGYK
jgi:hypothetical protein